MRNGKRFTCPCPSCGMPLTIEEHLPHADDHGSVELSCVGHGGLGCRASKILEPLGLSIDDLDRWHEEVVS